MTASYRLDWAPGSNAVFEMYIPDADDGGVKMWFTPPLRGTLRLPVGTPGLTRASLHPVDDQIKAIFAETEGTAGDGGPPPAPQLGPLPTVQDLGQQLFDIALPTDVGWELRDAGLFLEFGTDEALQNYPWELLHDGDEFYCLKHFIGRYVNVSEGIAGGAKGPKVSLGPFNPLRALVVCVDKPPPVNGVALPALLSAYQEMIAVGETLTLLGVKAEPLGSGGRTHEAVWKALSSGLYQIVHFIGHIYVDPDNPGSSGLILQDQMMTAANVYKFLTKKARPVLCFVNGCESSRALADEVSFGKYGLARAILESGAYLLGTRWKVSDGPASLFAQAFYKALLTDGKPIGQAVTEARRTCQAEFPNDPAWASYAYYGDPRVCFRKC